MLLDAKCFLCDLIICIYIYNIVIFISLFQLWPGLRVSPDVRFAYRRGNIQTALLPAINISIAEVITAKLKASLFTIL